MRQGCFVEKSDGSGYDRNWWVNGCDTAELIEKDGFLYQKGGPPMNQEEACATNIIEFAFPYELGFVLNFTEINNYPRGCGPLDGEWRMKYGKPNCHPYCPENVSRPNKLYLGSPGYDGSPPCGPNSYAPEGEATADIVAKFAEDHEEWQKSFFDGWEKFQLNGYNIEDLTESPNNGQLLINNPEN